MAAPSCMETLKRQAVLRKMRSKYSSSLMRWPSFSHLEQLALDHLLGERDEEVEDAEVALFEGGGEGLHVEPVAGEDALGVAPGGVGGGAAAAGVGLVDDVVVDEGGGVEHLDDGAEADAASALVQPRALAESSSSSGRMRLPPPAMRYWRCR